MLKKKNTIQVSEFVIISFVWILLIATPIFIRDNNTFELEDLLRPMITLLPLFIIFIINRFILVPKLLLKKNNISYLISVGILIGIITLGFFFISTAKSQNRSEHQIENNWRTPPPPMEGRNIGRPDPRKPLPSKRKPMPAYANLLIFSFLMVGFDTGLITSFRLTKSERKRAELEKENAESQLAYLRNQVSPHFFMNTLNNIHSLIDIDTEEAKESIIRLSKLMRHLLYESENDKIPIQKEIDFFKNYVELMKLRYSDKVKINLILPAQLPDKSIPPLLFTSYIENAFKHGITYQQTSYIDIKFDYTEDKLNFEIKNSNFKSIADTDTHGIGIENSRKRLDLIFGSNYELKIDDSDNNYIVKLSIPI